jgi:tellurite methyltransferase
MNPTANNRLSSHDWVTYYEAVAGRPPRETLLEALQRFEAEPQPQRERFAVDLGCGEGRDTIELLRRGWQVLAIDGESQGLERLRDRLEQVGDRPLPAHQLHTHHMRFEDLVLPPVVDLINASFCLTFCPPERFPALWQTITDALVVGGRFAGQLFGDLDSWACYQGRTHHTRQEVETLLRPFVVEYFAEEEHLGKTAKGEEKYWHLFHIVARK